MMAEVDLREIITRARIARELYDQLTKEQGFEKLEAIHLMPSILSGLLPFQLPIPPPRDES
jgi:hypothetical protein